MSRQHFETFNNNIGNQNQAMGFPLSLQANHRTLHRQRILSDRPMSESSLVRTNSNNFNNDRIKASSDRHLHGHENTRNKITQQLRHLKQQQNNNAADTEKKTADTEKKKKTTKKKKDEVTATKPPPTSMIAVTIRSSKKCSEIHNCPQNDDLDYCEHELRSLDTRTMDYEGKKDQNQTEQQKPVKDSAENKSARVQNNNSHDKTVVSPLERKLSSMNRSTKTKAPPKKYETQPQRSAPSQRNPTRLRTSATIEEEKMTTLAGDGSGDRELDTKREPSRRQLLKHTKGNHDTAAANTRNDQMIQTSKTEQEAYRETKKRNSAPGHQHHKKDRSELSQSCGHTQSQRFVGRSPEHDVRDVASNQNRHKHTSSQKQVASQNLLGEHQHRLYEEHLPCSAKHNSSQGSDMNYVGSFFPTKTVSTRNDQIQQQKQQQRQHLQQLKRPKSTPCLIDSIRANHTSPFDIEKQNKKNSNSFGDILRIMSSSHRRRKNSEAKKISDKWNVLINEGWGEC